MLSFYIASALFADMFGRPPRKREHADLLEAVRSVYAHLRRAPATDPTEALALMRDSARVRDILDVNLDGAVVAPPHSFVLHIDELAETTQKHRTCVIENLGCLIYYKSHYYLVTETSVKRTTLGEVFSKRRLCRSVIVLEAGAFKA